MHDINSALMLKVLSRMPASGFNDMLHSIYHLSDSLIYCTKK